MASEVVPLELSSSRLRFSRLTSAHVEDLLELDSDPRVMRYINGGIPTPRETLEKEHLPHIAAYDDCPYGYLAAYEGSSFVGWFHLRPSVADPSILELGYRLRHAAWGRGLATEGSRALLRHAFETLDQLEVDACTDPLNVASSRIMTKCGMRRVGSFVHPRRGVHVDRYLVRREEAVLDEPAP